MCRRDLGHPLLVVSDGAAGIIKAIETCFPRSARQRCLAGLRPRRGIATRYLDNYLSWFHLVGFAPRRQ